MSIENASVQPGGPSTPPNSPPPALSFNPNDPGAAKTAAFVLWLVMLIAPVLMVVATLLSYGAGSSAERPVVAGLFTAMSLGCLLLGLPAAMLLRSHVVRAQLNGESMDGMRYLKGMGTIWAATSIAGLLAGLACMLGGGLMPGVVPWLLAMIPAVAFAPRPSV